MADLKISQLPAAATLDGTELVAVVQSGTTDRTTVAAFSAAAAASGSVVASSDVGTAPNQIPLNQYLGTLAYQDSNAVSISGGVGTFTTLNTTGDVGIGTSTPARRLEVSNSSAPVVRFTRDQAISGQIVEISQPNTTDGNSLAILYTSSTTGTGAASDVNFAEIRFGADVHDNGTRAGSIRFHTTKGGVGFVERTRITADGNVKIGGTADRASTVGTNHLDIFNGTAPVGTLSNGISIYSSAGEAYVMDAAGNATLFSPHDADTNEWIFKSKHTPTGKVLKIDVERLLRFVNDHFGLDAVQEFIEE